MLFENSPFVIFGEQPSSTWILTVLQVITISYGMKMNICFYKRVIKNDWLSYPLTSRYEFVQNVLWRDYFYKPYYI
jgi:hypothetical protein